MLSLYQSDEDFSHLHLPSNQRYSSLSRLFSLERVPLNAKLSLFSLLVALLNTLMYLFTSLIFSMKKLPYRDILGVNFYILGHSF